MDGSDLHVTNGDCTVETMRAIGISEPIIPWRDTLHEGPVPAVSDTGLRGIRGRYLTSIDWPLGRHSEQQVAAEFAERDNVLLNHEGTYRLWFEADLYDQLQLIQILSMLDESTVDPKRITLLCIGEFPGIGHFGGLGQLTAEQLATLRNVG